MQQQQQKEQLHQQQQQELEKKTIHVSSNGEDKNKNSTICFLSHYTCTLRCRAGPAACAPARPSRTSAAPPSARRGCRRRSPARPGSGRCSAKEYFILNYIKATRFVGDHDASNLVQVECGSDVLGRAGAKAGNQVVGVLIGAAWKLKLCSF